MDVCDACWAWVCVQGWMMDAKMDAKTGMHRNAPAGQGSGNIGIGTSCSTSSTKWTSRRKSAICAGVLTVCTEPSAPLIIMLALTTGALEGTSWRPALFKRCCTAGGLRDVSKGASIWVRRYSTPFRFALRPGRDQSMRRRRRISIAHHAPGSGSRPKNSLLG
jgi:hypothetical protein